MLLPCNGDYFYIKDKVSIGNNSGKSVKEKNGNICMLWNLHTAETCSYYPNKEDIPRLESLELHNLCIQQCRGQLSLPHTWSYSLHPNLKKTLL